MHIRGFFIAMKKVFSISKSNTFLDISHLFYINILNDIDEDISAVVWVVFIEYSLVQSYRLPKFRLASL